MIDFDVAEERTRIELAESVVIPRDRYIEILDMIARLREELELQDRRSNEPVGCNDWNQLSYQIEKLRHARATVERE